MTPVGTSHYWDSSQKTIRAAHPEVGAVIAFVMAHLIEEAAERLQSKPRSVLQTLGISNADVLSSRKWQPSPRTMRQQKWEAYFAAQAPGHWAVYGAFLSAYMAEERVLPLPKILVDLLAVREAVLVIVKKSEWHEDSIEAALSLPHRFWDLRSLVLPRDMPSRLVMATQWPAFLKAVDKKLWHSEGEPIRAFVQHVVPYLEDVTKELKQPEKPVEAAVSVGDSKAEKESNKREVSGEIISVRAKSPESRAIGMAVRNTLRHHDWKIQAFAREAGFKDASFSVFIAGVWVFRPNTENWKKLYSFLATRCADGLARHGAILTAYHEGRDLRPFIEDTLQDWNKIVPKSDEAMAIGDAIRQVRLQKGRPASFIADQFGVKARDLRGIECGAEVLLPDGQRFGKLLEVLEQCCGEALQTEGGILLAYRRGTDLAPFMAEWKPPVRRERLRSGSPEARAIGAALALMRTEMGRTIDDMATLLGMQKNSYKNIEKGLNIPTPQGVSLYNILDIYAELGPEAFAKHGGILKAYRAGEPLAPFVVEWKKQIQEEQRFAGVKSSTEEAKALGQTIKRIIFESQQETWAVASRLSFSHKYLSGVEAGSNVMKPKSQELASLLAYFETNCAESYEIHKGILVAYRDGEDLTPFMRTIENDLFYKEKHLRLSENFSEYAPEAKLLGHALKMMRLEVGLTAKAVGETLDIGGEAGLFSIEGGGRIPRQIDARLTKLLSFYAEKYPAAFKTHRAPLVAYCQGQDLTPFIIDQQRSVPKRPSKVLLPKASIARKPPTTNPETFVPAPQIVVLGAKPSEPINPDVSLVRFKPTSAPQTAGTKRARTKPIAKPPHSVPGALSSSCHEDRFYTLLAAKVVSEPVVSAPVEVKPSNLIEKIREEMTMRKQQDTMPAVKEEVLQIKEAEPKADLSQVPEELAPYATRYPDAWAKHGPDLIKAGLAIEASAGTEALSVAPSTTEAEWRLAVSTFVAENAFGDGYGQAEVDVEEMAHVMDNDPFTPIESFHMALKEACNRQGLQVKTPCRALEKEASNLLNQYDELKRKPMAPAPQANPALKQILG